MWTSQLNDPNLIDVNDVCTRIPTLLKGSDLTVQKAFQNKKNKTNKKEIKKPWFDQHGEKQNKGDNRA